MEGKTKLFNLASFSYGGPVFDTPRNPDGTIDKDELDELRGN